MLRIFRKGLVSGMLKELCLLNGTSGDESAVRNFIIDQIKGKCEYKVDAVHKTFHFCMFLLKKAEKRRIKRLC